MPIWPFRRKSGRKRPRSGAALSDVEGPPLRSATEGVVPINRAGSIKKQRTEPARLQRRVRDPSYSPNRRDVLQVDRSARQPPNLGRDLQELHTAWERTPTLHATKDGRKASRRKSSRRKRKDPSREAEIKAMSQFMPVRPPADFDSAGRPMRKESYRARRGLGGRHWDDDPASDVSLPLPASIHSAMSSDSESPAFRISALDSLAPRPTLRYSAGARTSARTPAPVRAHSQRKTLAEKGIIAEETLRQHKRVDDLADDLDARDLRELMEREDRRRQKQLQKEQRRMEERLSRRAQKQRAEEAEARTSGTPPPQNLERGVIGRELVGLGIEPASAVVTSSRVRDEDQTDVMQDVEYDASAEQSQLRPKPSDSFQPVEAPIEEDSRIVAPRPAPVTKKVPQEQDLNQGRSSSAAEPEERVASLPSASVFATLLRRNKSRSKSTLNSDRDKTATPQSGREDDDERLRKNSETSYSKSTRFSLSSLWRKNGKNRRSASPPSFSNTSREEMQAVAYAHAQAQQMRQVPGQGSQEQLSSASLAQAQALAKLEGKEVPQTGASRYVAKNSNTIPKRTRSRFKEDLPEFPISPPASRVQSPEAEPPMPSLTEGKYATETQPIPIPNAMRYGTPTSDHRPADAMRSPVSPDPHQSISLASIDSEGSWLSGRVNARRASTMRESIVPSSRREPIRSSDSPTNSTQEDLAIMDDDYMNQLASDRRHSAAHSAHNHAEGRPSSDEEDFIDENDLKWGTTAGGHAHMVNRETMRSRQGMLEMIDADDEEQESSSSVETPAVEQASVGRAKSVDLASRGHGRNFSAGSAKLLNIAPRESEDRHHRRASEPLL